MNKIKIVTQCLLIILITVHLFALSPAFFPSEGLMLFFLFLIISVIDVINFNFISILISGSGVVLFNIILPFELAESTFKNIEIFLLVITSIWLTVSLFNYFNEIHKSSISDKKIIFNKKTKMFELQDGYIKYEISPDLIESLNEFNRTHSVDITEIWYRGLDEKDRKKVIKSINN